jgi:hypothetical protein
VLLIAFAAVDWPGAVWLEWDLGLLAAFGTGNVSHFSGSAVVAASKATAIFIFSLKHYIHLPCYRFKEPIMLQNISTNLSESTQNVTPYKGPSKLYICWSKEIADNSIISISR